MDDLKITVGGNVGIGILTPSEGIICFGDGETTDNFAIIKALQKGTITEQEAKKILNEDGYLHLIKSSSVTPLRLNW